MSQFGLGSGYAPLFGADETDFSTIGSGSNFMQEMLGESTQAMLSTAAQLGTGMLGGPDVIPTDPFATQGFAATQIQLQKRQLQEAPERAREASQELIRIDSRRMTAMTQAVMTAINGGPLDTQQKLFAAQQAETVSGLLRNPMAQMMFQQAGVDLSLLFPEQNLAAQSAQLLNAATRGAQLSPELIGQFAAELGKSAGIGFDGSLDPQASMGFTASQQAGLLRSLQLRGLAPISADAAVAGMSGQLQRDLAMGKPEAVNELASILAAQAEQALEPIRPAAALARDIFGAESSEDIIRAIQASTGGGLGRLSGVEIESRIAKIGELSQITGLQAVKLADYVDSVATAASRAGFDPTAAASAAVDSLDDSMLTVQEISRGRGGQPLPGIALSPSEIAEDTTRRLISAQGSNIAGTSAVALEELQKFSDVTGRSVEELVSSVSGEAGAALKELVNFSKGEISDQTINTLTDTPELADAIAAATGQQATRIEERLTDTALRQTALARNPDLIRSTADLQAVERASMFEGEIEIAAGRQLTDVQQAQLLSSARVFGGDVDQFMSSLDRQGLADILAPTQAELRAGIERFGSEDVARRAFFQEQASTLQQIASEAGLSNEQAQTFLTRDTLRLSQEDLEARAEATAAINRSLGGQPAFDRFLSELGSGDGFVESAIGAAGGIRRSDILNELTSDAAFMQEMTSADGAVQQQMLDMMSRIGTVDPYSRGAFQEAMNKALEISDPSDRMAALEAVTREQAATLRGVEQAPPSEGATGPSNMMAMIQQLTASIREALVQGLQGVTVVIGGDGEVSHVDYVGQNVAS